MTALPVQGYPELPHGLPVVWEQDIHGWTAVIPPDYPRDAREVTVGYLSRAWGKHPAGATVVVDHTKVPESIAISLAVESWAREHLDKSTGRSPT